MSTSMENQVHREAETKRTWYIGLGWCLPWGKNFGKIKRHVLISPYSRQGPRQQKKTESSHMLEEIKRQNKCKVRF